MGLKKRKHYYNQEEYNNAYVYFSRKRELETSYDHKYFLLVMFLKKHYQTCGQVVMSFKYMYVEEFGYSPTSNSNADVYDEYRQILNDLIKSKFIDCEENVLTVRPSKFFTLKVRTTLFTKPQYRFYITMEQYDKIISCKNISIVNVMAVYVYIRKFITYDSQNKKGNKYITSSRTQLAKYLNLSKSTINAAIKYLAENELIYVTDDIYVDVMGYYCRFNSVICYDKINYSTKKVKEYVLENYGYTAYTYAEIPDKSKIQFNVIPIGNAVNNSEPIEIRKKKKEKEYYDA